MSNLYGASRQWQTRPADQRFWTIAEMLDRMATLVTGDFDAVIGELKKRV